VAKSRSGTRGRRGPRKPMRRDGRMHGRFSRSLDPRERGAIELPSSITVKDLAELLGVNPADVIRELIKSGIFANINQGIDRETASLVAEELGYEVAEVGPAGAAVQRRRLGPETAPVSAATKEQLFEEDEASLLLPRAPIVTVMGHVDHGKTSLLDAIRTTKVAAGERGGITQHIGASEVVMKDGRRIVFLDTPGHEAFTAMRARGAKVTDIAVVVVARRRRRHAPDPRGDRPRPRGQGADHHRPQQDRQARRQPGPGQERLAEAGVVVEEYGGDVPMVPVSAKARLGLDELLEMIMLVADLQELKANPKRPAIGTIVEAELDKGRGPVATALVQTGTLRVGDVIVVGETYGKVRALENELGKRITKAGPSSPAVVLGLADVPQAGDILRVVADEKTPGPWSRSARRLRRPDGRAAAAPLSRTCTRRSRPARPRNCGSSSRPTCRARSAPSLHALQQLSTDEVRINVLHEAAGDVTDNDIMLAAASNAIVVGFSTKVTDTARRAAEAEKVDVRQYDIIYKLTDDISAALRGMLEPEQVETVEGRAEVRQIFRVGKVRGHRRLLRHRRPHRPQRRRSRLARRQGHHHRQDRVAAPLPKDDVREVATNFECGIGLAGLERPGRRRHHRVLHPADGEPGGGLIPSPRLLPEPE
jgi:translation initiation factor IF-2